MTEGIEMTHGRLSGRGLTRREFVKLGGTAAGAAALGSLLAACSQSSEELVGGGASPPTAGATAGGGGGGGGGQVTFVSTQLAPVEEAEKMRNEILADFSGSAEFIGEEPGPFVDRVIAQAEGGEVTVSLLGGLHGDFSPLVERDLLVDLSDLMEQMGDREFNQDFLDLASFGGDGLFYVPWMQATYIMAARKEAMEFLPDGADVNALTYDQLGQWGSNIAQDQGQRLGFPTADDGLIHRFFQGYSYPSFTGALNTAFASSEAVTMWEWMRNAWQSVNPQSITYAFMQEPLRSGEVWVAWDHVARLIDALEADPENMMAFPAPVGPEGLGYMPVVAGLAIPKGAPNEQAARDLISYLTSPETTQTTLKQVGFYPPFAGQTQIAEDLSPGIKAEAEAVAQTTNSEQAVPSLLPIGLGEQDGAYNNVFRTTFEAIVQENADIQQTLQQRAQELQQLLQQAEASCWRPDPESDGVCQVGTG